MGHYDPSGIVVNACLFEFFDASTGLLFEATPGVKAQELAAAYAVLGIPLLDARANFFKSAHLGDAVEIASRVSEFRRALFDVEHRRSVKGAPAVEGSRNRLWSVRDQDNSDKLHAHAIPAEAIAKFGRFTAVRAKSF
jgi:acyl-CoA thioesterase FadM